MGDAVVREVLDWIHKSLAKTDERVEAVDLVTPESLDTLDLRPPMAWAIQDHLAGRPSENPYLGPLFTEGRP